MQGMTAKQAHGELLLLKLITAGLQQDLRARLKVYAALRKSSLPEARKSASVLEGSLFWRMLQQVLPVVMLTLSA